MKIALFSDVQANVPAMEAMIEEIDRWNPDLVVMDGDLVNRGPCSTACLDLWQSLAANRPCRPLRGNHEDFVYYCSQHAPASKGEADIRAFTDWTVAQLGERVGECRPWPDHLLLDAPAATTHWVHITHGTLSSNRQGIRKEMTNDEIAAVIPAGVDYFITAHTHRPIYREVNGTRVLNIGSVGSPFDGDPRASYARLVWNGAAWQASIERFEYDRDRARQDYVDSGFLAEGGPIARLIFEEWYRAKSLIPYWHQRYRDAVLRGDISAAQAVDEFIATL
jgi:predicted phosphodiesterase